MLQLVGPKLTRVGEPSAAHTAAAGAREALEANTQTVLNNRQVTGLWRLPVGLHVAVLHHVSLQVTGLSEGFVANLAFVGPHALVGEQVCVQVTQLLEQLPTQVTPVRLDAVVPQDVRDQVIFGGVRLFAHATLPPLLVSAHVHVVAVIHVDAQIELFGRAAARSRVLTAMPGSEALSGVEGARGEGHDGAGHEYGVRQEAVGEGREVGRVEEERSRRPDRRTKRFLFQMHGDI